MIFSFRQASVSYREKLIQGFVGLAWLGTMLTALVIFALFSYDIPLAEDWTLVAPLTGHEDHFWQWVWSQNNEHRVPLPRLILLGLLKVSGGSFRVGMIANIALLAAISGLLIRTAARLRGGTVRITDAVFPLLLLHLGNWPNLFWSWQLSFVLPIATACGIFMILLADPSLRRRAAARGVCILFCTLPFYGAVGLGFIPAAAAWMAYAAWKHWREDVLLLTATGRWLLGGLAVCAMLIGIYFIGYQTPEWIPPSPGLRTSLITAMKIFALGLGPAADYSYLMTVPLVLLIYSSALAVAWKGWRRSSGAVKDRAAGIMLWTLGLLFLLVVLGNSRAGLVPEYGIPLRYIHLSSIPLLTVYFIFDRFLPGRLRTWMTGILFGLMLVLYPFNSLDGYRGWGKWYHRHMKQVAEDIQRDAVPDQIARDHGEFLVHWWNEDQLSTAIRQLREARISSFQTMRPDE